MKAKEKKEKKVKITIKNLIYFLIFVVFILYSIIFYNLYFSKKVYATEESFSETTKEIKISNAEEVNLEEIISENTNNGQREEYEAKEEVLEYITKYRTNNDLPKGIVQVVQEGREGTQEITVKKTYQGEELVNEEQVSQKVTKASINKIVEIGGGAGTSNYTVKVGDTLYVTSDRLSVMTEPDENSQKVATLSKNDELKLKEIKDQWYKIESGTARGYVKAECTTYLNPNQKYEEEKTEENNSSTTNNTTNDIPNADKEPSTDNKPEDGAINRQNSPYEEAKQKSEKIESLKKKDGAQEVEDMVKKGLAGAVGAIASIPAAAFMSAATGDNKMMIATPLGGASLGAGLAGAKQQSTDTRTGENIKVLVKVAGIKNEEIIKNTAQVAVNEKWSSEKMQLVAKIAESYPDLQKNEKAQKEVKDLLRANGVKSEKLIEKALRDVYKVQPKQSGNKDNDNIEKWK